MGISSINVWFSIAWRQWDFSRSHLSLLPVSGRMQQRRPPSSPKTPIPLSCMLLLLHECGSTRQRSGTAMRRLCAGADSALSASVTTLDPTQDDLLLTKMAANVSFSDIAPDLHRNLIARSPKGFFGVCLPTRSKSKDSDGTIMQRRAASQKIRRPTPGLITGW